jgi:Na+-translocating ferredoxin:NAD+ oxidoreductase subunit G
MSGEKGFWPVVFLTLVVIVAIVALTLTDAITKDKIACAKQDEVQQMLCALFPNMQSFSYDQGRRMYTVLAGGEAIGLAFIAEGKGYGGTIDILVGIKPDEESLQGIRIITQQETPGLGAKISSAEFLDQFSGIALEEVALTRNGGKIDAITGATISSRAVVNAVEEAIMKGLVDQNREEES